MRELLVSAALAVVMLGGMPTVLFAAPTPTATPRAQVSPSPTVKPAPNTPTATTPPTASATPTRAATAPPTPTAAPTRPPTALPAATPPRAAAPTATRAPAGAVQPPPAGAGQPPPAGAGQPPPAGAASASGPTPAPPAAPEVTPTAVRTVAAPATGAIRGLAFVDNNANGELEASDAAFGQVDIALSSANALIRTTRTNEDGSFAFEGLVAGPYRVMMAVPIDYVATTDAGIEVDLAADGAVDGLHFGLISMQAAGLRPPTGEQPDQAQMDDEQIIALASVTSLPLRFAAGRDLMAQVGKRVLGDGLVWLGVPFRSQIDGGDFQFVNCGPASLTMVLAAFGLEVGPSQVRDYLNNIIDNFDTDLGTSLEVLSRIGRDAGLTSMDLYSDRGGYRNWSTDAVRWHVQQGHPVITLVKYRNLPGHTKSISEFDHYIVISGLTPNGFIYNDAAFASTLGYGLEISDIELEYAWDNSSIPHHALALGLAPDKKALTFPELPRTRRPAADAIPAVARGARRLAESDEAERAPLRLAPVVPMPLPAVASPSGPLITTSERWQDDPDFATPPPIEDGAPMGMNMEPTEQPTLEPRPGPGAMVPKLLAVIGTGWLVWLVWSLSGRLVRLRPPLRAAFGALAALLGLTR